MTSPLTTVVFDLGNVLIDWDPRRLYRTLISDQADLDHFLGNVASFDWHYQQDSGRDIHEATAELQASHPEHAELIGAFYERWYDMIGGSMPATVDILRELRDAGVRVLGLTNWPAGIFEPARERFPFLNWFEGIVVSGEEKLAKPDAAIFQLLLDRYAVDPSRAAYVDDTTGHVETARSLGMTAFRYTSAVQLRRDFASVGLPVVSDADVRPATADDVAAIADIYNHFVVNTAVTFDVDPVSLADRQEWFAHYATSGRHRCLVATWRDEVVGYATSSAFRAKRAYDPSVEATVYLHPDVGGRGLGSMLYQQLFADLKAEDVHRAYAAIALPNDASLALHRRFGFTDIGTMHEVGRKHDKWWDVMYLERALP